jgi:hypothetical protein
MILSKLMEEPKILYCSSLPELKAEIRREARKRCLEELEAYSKGEDIESGIGVDVERAYLMMIQRHEQKDGFVSR